MTFYPRLMTRAELEAESKGEVMITKFKVIYFVASDSLANGGYFIPKEFDTRSEAADFAQEQLNLYPAHKPILYEQQYREEGDPAPVCEGCQGSLNNDYSEYCSECCEHDFDPDEGFSCLNCGKQGEPSDVYDEDYGQDR